MMPVDAEAPRTAHLFPKPNGWILVLQGEEGVHFADLGRALDAATAGGKQVVVVVHQREVA